MDAQIKVHMENTYQASTTRLVSFTADQECVYYTNIFTHRETNGIKQGTFCGYFYFVVKTNLHVSYCICAFSLQNFLNLSRESVR